ncbi:MAG: CpaF family protein [Bdellovibrionales bacterium]|nr:CpaF family protein [Bdellovibrionales bacterium]MBT3526131.1 CpaF family protein [Bdellovibrionales bacterium]MBT7668730.1 CpaF family protein [Bdellovibrionales bacterium]MBT7766872.1 CpaF family protein [Bdellovibrionales bacterium]
MSNDNPVWNFIDELKQQPRITEIVINGVKSIFIEEDGHFIHLDHSLAPQDISHFINDVAKYNNRECNRQNPILDGLLPDGSRINIILPPYAHRFPAITIRKYLKNFKKFEENSDIFGLNNGWIKFLKSLVEARLNIMVSGGTGVGKTTLLNMLLNEINPTERVVTIEDTLELNLSLTNLVRLEARGNSAKSDGPSIGDLVKNTLRMRPDRIVIGEVRGGELFHLLQAMNTGHEGSMSSIHANSPAESLGRMQTLFLLSGMDLPHQVVCKQITDSVDYIIQLSRTRRGERIISHITEITGLEASAILTNNIAIYEDGRLIPSKVAPQKMGQIHERSGLPLDFLSTIMA